MNDGPRKAANFIATSEQGAATRLAAALAIADVLGDTGCTLGLALERRTANLHDTRDIALSREIAFGVLRMLPQLRGYASELMIRNFKAKDLDVECLLLVGLYQLDVLRVPDHAAISETVAATKKLRKVWASGFVNAVLRNFQRRRNSGAVSKSKSKSKLEEAIKHNFPDWLAARLFQDWPEHAISIMQASDVHPPMSLRVNLGRITRDAYIERLRMEGLMAYPLTQAPAALVLEHPVDVINLPGFNNGLISVQDEAAQLAGSLLDIFPEAQILDACAAPGGKTAQILETWPNVQITAVDIDAERVSTLRQGLMRLGLSARLLTADLLNTETQGTDTASWDDRLYDRILLDAPCSATGVIRRHPDIKWLRRATDIAKLSITQGRILDRLWPLVRPGGILLYITCSILSEENQEVISAFLSRTPDSRELPLNVTWGNPCSVGRQILTGENGMDGFYFAKIVRSIGMLQK